MPPKGWRSTHSTPRDRKREWSYVKRRRNPTGVMGRPRSSILFAERRKLARRNFKASLVRRGLRVVRLQLSVETVKRLDDLCRERGATRGEVVTDLLDSPGATGLLIG